MADSVAYVAAPVALAVAGGLAAFTPVGWTGAALWGVRSYITVTSVQSNPTLGLAGIAGTVALEYLLPGSSEVASTPGKYLIQTGKSIHRVKDTSAITEGAKVFVQAGKSIHRLIM